MSTSQYYDGDTQRFLSEEERKWQFELMPGAEDYGNALSRSPNLNKKLSPRRPSPSGANGKRKRQSVGYKSAKAKVESSASQQAEAERKKDGFEEHLEKKTVKNVTKILNDRVDRQIKIVRESIKSLTVLDLVASIDPILIKSQRELLSELENIKEEIKKNRGSNILTIKVPDEMKPRLILLKNNIEILTELTRKGSTEVKKLGKSYEAEIQSQNPLCSALKDLEDKANVYLEEMNSIKVNGMEVTDEMDQKWVDIKGKFKKLKEQHKNREEVKLMEYLEKLVTTEGISVDTQREKPLVKDFKDFESRLFAEERMVGVSDFQGLPEALRKTNGSGSKVPDYLKPITIRIEKARGKTTDFMLENIEILVCAAIHEMEHELLEDLDEGMLSRWGATLKNAEKFGFQVDFADSHFRKNMYAYYLRSKLH